jgi:membrane-bound lytic murein transglycosylase F
MRFVSLWLLPKKMRAIPVVPLFVVVLCGLYVVVTASTGRPPVAASHSYQQYDDYFRKYSKRYFGDGFDWRLFKAQAIVESNLKSNVVSASGARGVMQLMSPTFAAAQRRNKDFGDINNPEWNIAAGIWYAHEEWKFWNEQTDKKFQKHFMLGSYNAGHAPLLRAQKLAVAEKLNYKRWPTIEKVAERVPNWRYKETLAYVGGVFVNLSNLDRKGEVKGPTISKDNGDGTSLPDKVKHFLSLFKRVRFWDDE